MFTHKKIKVGSRFVQGLSMSLGRKRLVVLAGRRGYCMCGYLNMKAANAFKDVAVKVAGVSTIAEAQSSRVHSCSKRARALGAYPGQSIRDFLKIIA